MTEKEHCKRNKPKMSLRSLRLSLKYRPGLMKLILKMRQCIRKRNTLLKSLKHRLKKMESNKPDNANNDSATNSYEKDETMQSVSDITQFFKSINTKEFQDSSTQTDFNLKNKETKPEVDRKDSAWNLNKNGDTEKSIAEQVKEAAQSALQDNGMVYVESAGMYYDYKTGYYYNSELGLYYHTDTGCYYYYSDDKQFVFHSYPDMSKVNASLIAHQKKKARKLKREKEGDGGNPKKPRKSKKMKKEKNEKKMSQKNKVKDGRKDKMYVTKDKNDSKEETGQKEEILVEVSDDKQDTKKEESAEQKMETADESKIIDCKNNICGDTKNQDDVEQSQHIDNAMDMFEGNAKSKVECIKSADKDIENNVKIKNPKEAKIEFNDQVENKLELETTLDVTDNKEKIKEDENEDLEDGECSDTESEDSGSESEASSTSTVSDEDCVAKHHPPCMRVIVRDTKLPKLKVGSLFLITKDGGTVGREGEQHAILLKDHNVSRNHLDIKYDVFKKTYIATDLGSKNGTILNGVRMSESQDVSLPLDILHGSTIQVGETKLLCHIHPGHTTCGQCEPGLLMQAAEEKKAAYTRTVSVKKQHELELARLKNIYAPTRLAIEEKPYSDRAQARRETVGSMNHAEKTQSSDMDTAIASENKGFKLLQKMGWSKGEGLGKDSQGETEPVPLISNEGKAGLGTAGAVAPPTNTPKPRVVKNNLAAATLRLAARTKMLKPPAKAFQNEDEDEDE